MRVLLKNRTVIVHIAVFWVVTQYSLVGGYRRFGGPCCRHFMKTENGGSKTSRCQDLKDSNLKDTLDS
jgi:hypothetical protein